MEQCEPRLFLHGDDVLLGARSDVLYGSAETAEVGPIAPAPLGAQPLSALPRLNSLPSARAQLYLDFDGTEYDGQTYPAFSRDTDRTTFSDAELAEIKDAFARVAEYFSPFNINVTTVEPPRFTQRVTSEIVIVDDGGGAWAYVGSFNGQSGGFGRVGDNGWGNGRLLGMVIAHEAGHTFGLSHQGVFDANGTKTQEYNPGNSSTGPIMGAPYGASRQLWWHGPSSSAQRSLWQHDARILVESNGFTLRPDEAPDSVSLALPLAPRAPGEWNTQGVISSEGDRDFYRVELAAAGTLDLVANPAAVDSAMLDLRLELLDATGRSLRNVDPETLGANLSMQLEAGVYNIMIASHRGVGDIGQYSLNANFISRPWNYTALASTAGSATATSNSAKIVGHAGGLRGRADGYNYLHQTADGNFQAVVRMEAIPDPGRTGRGGLMVRSNNNPDTAAVSLDFTSNTGVRLVHRAANGENVASTAPILLETPGWLRLTRRGNTFSGEYSADGETWNSVGEVSAAVEKVALVGLFAAGSGPNRVIPIEFKDFALTTSLTPLPGDVNRDGKVDVVDFTILRGNFGLSDIEPDGGDLTGDRHVDLADFIILRKAFGTATTSPPPVLQVAPSPSQPGTESPAMEPVAFAVALSASNEQNRSAKVLSSRRV